MSTQHQGPPIARYTPQSSDKVALVNDNKRVEENLVRTLDSPANAPNVDGRWLAIGRTKLEEAFMAINRAIFRPERVKLPGDTP
jgi:hypothetical protein